MKKLVLALAVAAAAVSAPAQAQRLNGLGILALDPVDDGNTVLTVNGEGVVVRQADVAIFTAGVTTTGKTADEALRSNATQMAAVIAAARKLGIADKDIQTSQISIAPVMSTDREYRRGNISLSSTAVAVEAAAEAAAEAMEEAMTEEEETPRIVGYRATNSVAIRQRKLDDFGRTIDRLVAAGANKVNGPRFQLEQSQSTEEEARLMAIKDARRRADLVADAAGMRVVRIVMMDEGRVSGLSSTGNSFGFFEAMESSYDVYYEDTQILSGELTITASVGMLFELTPQ